MEDSFAAWDPFTDPSDALQGRTTAYAVGEEETSPEVLWDPLAGQRASASMEPEEASPDDNWDPFEDPEIFALAAELALQLQDMAALEAWVEQAKAARLPRDKVQPKEDRLRLGKARGAARAPDIPFADLGETQAAAEEPARAEAASRLQGLLARRPQLEEAVAEEPGEAATRLQGLLARSEPEATEREEPPEVFQEEPDDFAREAETSWNLIYWPLCVALASSEEIVQAMCRHAQVVVLGWDACHDVEVMKLSQELSHSTGSDHLIVTGNREPPEDWWPTPMEEAAMEEAARESPLRGSRTAKTKTSVLRIDRHGRPEQLGPALMSGLRAAGCCNMALLVVSRAFQSRRPVSVLAWCLQREDFADFQVAVLPYSWEPRAVYLEDCQQRGEDVLLEAQLLTEMNPTVWLEEEGQEAEVALSRLLLAHPKPRQHWHEGFYSKHFKDARLQGAHCEWFRWERPAPISAESHAKAALTRQGMETVAPDDDDDDDEDLPPLVSHEQT